MFASPIGKSNAKNSRQMAVKNISKEEYGSRMDIPKN